MAITMDGIFVNGQQITFHPENILTGDMSAYTEEIGTAVEEWLEENVTGGEQVTDTTLTLPGVPADAEATGDKIEELKEDLSVLQDEILTDVTVATVTQNASSSNVTDVALGVTLESGKEYEITIKSSVAFAADSNIYFRDTSNLNKLGVLNAGNTEQTFVGAPTADATTIRISGTNSGYIYTITVVDADGGSIIDEIESDISQLEGAVFTTKTVATMSKATTGTGASTTLNLGVVLSPNEKYTVSVSSTIPFADNTAVRFYSTHNLNVLGIIEAGSSGGTFTGSPSEGCESIRIQSGQAGAVFTVTITKKSTSILDLTDNLFNVDGTYTESFDINIPAKKYENMVITSHAMYTGETAPSIQASRQWSNATNDGSIAYKTPLFTIGEKNCYTVQQWRVPPQMDGMSDYTKISVSIPSGTTLYIRCLKNEYNNAVVRSTNGIHLNAHGKAGHGGAFNTKIQFDLSAQLGYAYCIAIPKITSDGVLVCHHDDDSIQNYARNPDGTEIDAQYQNVPLSGFTYEQLLQFDFGIVRGQPFKGQTIPTLEEFFSVCSKTGMHPMLSVHPNLDGHWGTIKNLAIKYNVLDTLNIKASREIITTPMSVLLDDIESYTIDTSGDVSSIISSFNSMKETYGLNTVRMVIEYHYSAITQSIANSILAAGYVCGCYSFASSSAEYYDNIKGLIAMGVTEFTDDYNCSCGLNW